MTTDLTKIEETITQLITQRGTDKTICPSEVARAIAGKNEKEWRLLMKPIRMVAVHMAKQGKLSIMRKGKHVNPDDFKGIYRLGIPQTG